MRWLILEYEMALIAIFFLFNLEVIQQSDVLAPLALVRCLKQCKVQQTQLTQIRLTLNHSIL